MPRPLFLVGGPVAERRETGDWGGAKPAAAGRCLGRDLRDLRDLRECAWGGASHKGQFSGCGIVGKALIPVAGEARSPLRETGAWAETSGTSKTSGSVPGMALRDL